ncbi:hypothetical protein KPH14_005185 [Odynerus spinipes]|nr:hypothetical protein KPH14_005185 [Odynerus spinipes]
MKLKPPIVKQQTSKACTGVSTKANTLNRFVTTCKQNKTEELKSKTVKKDQAKPKHIEHNSINSSALLKRTAQKNSRVLNTDSIVKLKQTSTESETPRSCSSSVSRQERVSSQKSTTSKKIISALVDNGSEIIIKKKKILFFDIPVHSKQKKTTCPVPFSFENRNKIKKQLQLDRSESASIKSESVTGVKSVLDINKTQKNKNKFGNFARNGVTSFCSHKVTNEKDKNIKKPEKCEKVGTYMSSVTMRKPMRVINALKEKEKIEKRKNEDIQNKKDTNREQNPLKSILYRNIHINKNTKIQAKETLQISKRVQKENRQPNINVSTTNNKNLNQKQEVKPKSTAVKINVDERGKRHEFEERMKQKKLMHEEKLRKEREEKLAKEKLEIAKLRKQAEIKARPMPVYKPLIHIKSTKPLTKPQSPAWSNKHRVTMIKETS